MTVRRFYFTQDAPRPSDYREGFLTPDGGKFIYIRFLPNPPRGFGSNDLWNHLEDYSTVAGIRIFLKIEGYTEVTEKYVKKLMVME